MNKAELRRVYLEKRNFLSLEEAKRRNEWIGQRTIAFLSNHPASVVHIFLSIEKFNEVNTWPIIEAAQALGKRVVVPRVIPNTNTLEHYYFESRDQLKTSKWGILEPEEGEKAMVQDFDLVFIPLICFDKIGYRIGYGKGFYDRFLKESTRPITKVGLSIAPPLDYIPYSEAHDIPLDFCITPFKNYDLKA